VGLKNLWVVCTLDLSTENRCGKLGSLVKYYHYYSYIIITHSSWEGSFVCFFDTTAERERPGLKNQNFQIPNWCWNSRIALNELFNSLVLCGLTNYFTLLFTLSKWVNEISFLKNHLHHAIINKFNSVQFLFLHYTGYLHTICKVK